MLAMPATAAAFEFFLLLLLFHLATEDGKLLVFRIPAFTLFVFLQIAALQFRRPVVAHAGPLTDAERAPWVLLTVLLDIGALLMVAESIWHLSRLLSRSLRWSFALNIIFFGIIIATAASELDTRYGEPVRQHAMFTCGLAGAFWFGLVVIGLELNILQDWHVMVGLWLSLKPFADVIHYFFPRGSWEYQAVDIGSRWAILLCMAAFSWILLTEPKQSSGQDCLVSTGKRFAG